MSQCKCDKCDKCAIVQVCKHGMLLLLLLRRNIEFFDCLILCDSYGEEFESTSVQQDFGHSVFQGSGEHEM